MLFLATKQVNLGFDSILTFTVMKMTAACGKNDPDQPHECPFWRKLK